MSNKNASFTKVNIVVSVCACVLALSILPFVNLWQTNAAGTITGQVFQDYNASGVMETATTAAIDAGVANITVRAYDSSGTLRGTATTAANGTYSLAAAGTGPYRVEFSTLPTGFQPSSRSTNSVNGRTATNAGSTVQFVPDGNTANVNLAINRPVDYCQNNPTVCIPQSYLGNVDGGSLRTFPYSFSNTPDGNATRPTDVASNNSTGTLFGVAWNSNTNNLYTSAFVKRAAKLGALSNESTGAIYVKNNPATAAPAATVYVNLNTVFGANTAGVNPHPVATTTTFTDDNATNASVGKTGLGDLKLSQDGLTLYTVNLADRRLYVIPTAGTLDNTTITRFDIPTTNLTTAGGICPTADVRPFALGRDVNGQIYVGAVCSAESVAANPATFLHAFVWRFSAGAFTLVANTTLNYSRALFRGNAGLTNNSPWVVGDNATQPELMLTDIEFDRGNNMILGLRDKNGDESLGPADRGYGDILRAAPNGATWTFENNGTSGGVTTSGANTFGLGGGEYYVNFNGDNRNEGSQGGLYQLAGFNHVVTTAYDAVSQNAAGVYTSNFFTGGIQRYNNTTGTYSGAYNVYLNGEANSFSKSNGLGDVEALCDRAPIEIGNRVWRDLDGDGVQDANEVGIAGVTVHLYNAANQLIATAVTDANGEYYFVSGTAADGVLTDNIGIVNGQILPNTNYSIRLDAPANYASGGPLNGIFLTISNQSTQAGLIDSTDSDAFLTANPTGSPTGNFPVITLTTGGAGNNSHTNDFGFSSAAPTAAKISVGGRVVDHFGRGINGARMTITSQTGAQRTVVANSFGNFTFNDVEAGENNVIGVSAKRYTFSQSSQFVSANESVDNVYFISDN